MKKRICIGAVCISMFLAAGCGDVSKKTDALAPETEQSLAKSDAGEGAISDKEAESTLEEMKNGTESACETEAALEVLNFVDVFGQEYQVEIDPKVAKHTYQPEAFIHNGDLLSYEGDSDFTYRLGVDVSHHQGTVDWKTLKSEGIEFAFLRIGYRGYGAEGKICLDNTFFENIEQAQAEGIDVGVYFFSQAINEAEAKEEAEFVLENLKGYELQLPVVYDPESILDDEARTDNVSGEQFTKNTIEFCRVIRENGYEPMIYSNMLWEAYELDLAELSDLPIWYADYEAIPQTPYHFTFWQYTNTANINGVTGAVDMNIQLVPTNYYEGTE